VGLGGTGISEWWVARAGKPINGERYASPQQSILRILFAPEKDGKRVCTVVLNGYPGHEPEDDSPITFTIDTGRGRRFATRPAPRCARANDSHREAEQFVQDPGGCHRVAA
jgi:hypothetical protein